MKKNIGHKNLIERLKGTKIYGITSGLCAIWSQRGLCIYPEVNLVSNIGHGPEAIHTKNPKDPRANLPIKDMWEIQHPPSVARNKEADIYTFDHVFRGRSLVSKTALLFGKKKDAL